MSTAVHRDLIAIGCSAGGVRALPEVLGPLPPELPAAVIVVQHLAPSSTLVDILRGATRLRVEWAEQGARIEHGTVYVAPPDAHLLAVDSHLRLDGGPRENHVRPSIDRAFRSLATHHGARTIGAILTGMLDDGVVGLAAIRACGGYAIIEDPATAEYAELPANALARAGADRIVPLDGVAAAILAALAEPAIPRDLPRGIALEAALDLGEASASQLDAIGHRVTMPCLECAGPLWEVGAPPLAHYRCYLGHVASKASALAYTVDEVSRALWTAIRALHDREELCDALARETAMTGNHVTADAYARQAREARRSGDAVRALLNQPIARRTRP